MGKERLRKEAIERAKSLGHELEPFHHYSDTDAYSHCKLCDLMIAITTRTENPLNIVYGLVAEVQCPETYKSLDKSRSI